MRVFVIVLVGATVIGGFVGGELMGMSFSLTGAVIGGVGVGAVLLGLGAYFHAQEERKKKAALPPEMRAVFDRMLGVGDAATPRSRRWKPRPFHKNESKEQVSEWFANVEPWSHLDPRLLRVLIDRLYGNPMFEVFVHASQSCGVVPQYDQLRALFDQGVGDVAACSKVAQILVAAGSQHAVAFTELLRSRRLGKSAEEHYQGALDAYEAAIHVEPAFLPAYLQLAVLKQLVGKADDAVGFCEQGLAQVRKMKKSPLPTRPGMNLMGAVEEAEGQFRTLLQALRAC